MPGPENPRDWINPGWWGGPLPGCEGGGSPFACDPGPGFGDEGQRQGRQIIREQHRVGGAGNIIADARASYFRGTLHFLNTGTGGGGGSAQRVSQVGGGPSYGSGPRSRGRRRRGTRNPSMAGLEERLRIQREQIRRETARAAQTRRENIQHARLRARLAPVRSPAIVGFAAFIADQATQRSFAKIDEQFLRDRARRALGSNFPSDPGKRGGKRAAPATQPIRPGTITLPEPGPVTQPRRAPAPAPGPARRSEPSRPSPAPAPVPGSPVRRPVGLPQPGASPRARPSPVPVPATLPRSSPGWIPWELPIPELRPVQWPSSVPVPRPARFTPPRAVPMMPPVVAVPRAPSPFPAAPPAASPLTTINPTLLTSLQPEPQPETDPCAKGKPKRKDQTKRCRNPVISRRVQGDILTTKVRLTCPRSKPKPL